METEIIKRFSNGFFATHKYYDFVEHFKDHDNYYQGYCSKILNENLEQVYHFEGIPKYSDYIDGRLLADDTTIIDDKGNKIYSGTKDLISIVWQQLKETIFTEEERISKAASGIVLDWWIRDFTNYDYYAETIDILITKSSNLEELFLLLKYLKRYCLITEELKFEKENIFYHFDLYITLKFFIQNFKILDKIDYWDRYNEPLVQ